MPTIYLVRHGQTDWNAALRLQGQVDTPLNETGRGQASRNGGVLAKILSNPEAFDFVASPLGRTRETMEIIRAALDLPADSYRTDDVLKEIHFGDWQGLTWDQLREAHPKEVDARFQDPWGMVVPGRDAESYSMLSERVLDWFSGITRDTVAVTHCGVIRCVKGHIEQTPEQQIPHIEIPQDRVYMASENQVELL